MLKDIHVKCNGGCFKREMLSLTTVILRGRGEKHQKLILLISSWAILTKQSENLPGSPELVSMY